MQREYNCALDVSKDLSAGRMAVNETRFFLFLVAGYRMITDTQCHIIWMCLRSSCLKFRSDKALIVGPDKSLSRWRHDWPNQTTARPYKEFYCVIPLPACLKLWSKNKYKGYYIRQHLFAALVEFLSLNWFVWLQGCPGWRGSSGGTRTCMKLLNSSPIPTLWLK